MHGGKDTHYFLTTLGFDDLLPAWLVRSISGTPVFDDGVYGKAEAAGVFDRREMFTRFDGGQVVWAKGDSDGASWRRVRQRPRTGMTRTRI